MKPAKPSTVRTCRPTHDGSWLIVLANGDHGSSPTKIPEGARAIKTPTGGIVKA